jgi:ribosome biogenesis GTP-binding protein YsxC/EngB
MPPRRKDKVGCMDAPHFVGSQQFKSGNLVADRYCMMHLNAFLVLVVLCSCNTLFLALHHCTQCPQRRTALWQRTITGVDLVNCRSFSTKDPKEFKFIGSFGGLNAMPASSIPEVAFVGKSNVGKSSLLNVLTGHRKKLAVEGSTPGTTKLINSFQCSDRTGPICSFVDLPGYGYAKLSRELQEEVSKFLRDYLLARRSLKVVILLMDSRREPGQDDTEMLQVRYTGVLSVACTTILLSHFILWFSAALIGYRSARCCGGHESRQVKPGGGNKCPTQATRVDSPNC